MKEEIKNTLLEAGECLLDAETLIKSSRWKAAVSRSYYSMYHTAKAALLLVGVETFTHHGVLNKFAKYFIKTNIFDKSLSYSFTKLFETRMVSDYEIGFFATEEDTMDALSSSYFIP